MIRCRNEYNPAETSWYYLGSRYYDPQVGRFINADYADIATASPTSLTDKNLYAYCDNNPVMRSDEDGECWNVIIGAFVGGVIGGVIAGITSYKETGRVDWGSVLINAAVGAASGAIAATGLGAFAQAGITAAISGVGNAAEQIHTKGLDNFNPWEVLGSASLGYATSLIGTGAGKLIGAKINNAGKILLDKGRGMVLTGVLRRSVGQSHSTLIRKGTKLISQGMIKINTFRGLSSVIGSGIGVGTYVGYNSAKPYIFR